MQQTVENIWMTFISYHSKRVSSNRTYMAVGKYSQLFDLNTGWPKQSKPLSRIIINSYNTRH